MSQFLNHQLNGFASDDSQAVGPDMQDVITGVTAGEIGPSPYPDPAYSRYFPAPMRADRLAANIPGDYTSIAGNTNRFTGGLGGSNQ